MKIDLINSKIVFIASFHNFHTSWKTLILQIDFEKEKIDL